MFDLGDSFVCYKRKGNRIVEGCVELTGGEIWVFEAVKDTKFLMLHSEITLRSEVKHFVVSVSEIWNSCWRTACLKKWHHSNVIQNWQLGRSKSHSLSVYSVVTSTYVHTFLLYNSSVIGDVHMIIFKMMQNIDYIHTILAYTQLTSVLSSLCRSWLQKCSISSYNCDNDVALNTFDFATHFCLAFSILFIVYTFV